MHPHARGPLGDDTKKWWRWGDSDDEVCMGNIDGEMTATHEDDGVMSVGGCHDATRMMTVSMHGQQR